MAELGPTPCNYVQSDIFAVKLLDKFLVYAPLIEFAALMNHTAIRHLRDGLTTKDSRTNSSISEVLLALRTKHMEIPAPKQGNLAPVFLGILPTRACNLACRYCNFVPTTPSHAMPLEIARDAVDWYMNCVQQMNGAHAEIHFFGGEPFCANPVLDLTIAWAKFRAQRANCKIRFEVATNGIFDEERGRWASDNFDTIVLSFDGPPEIQNHYRPYYDGKDSFTQVARSAKLLSEGTAQLNFRCCITDQTVDHMADLAMWFCENFEPYGICFEPVQPMALSSSSGLIPPDPWNFARNFIQAATILNKYGVEPIYSSADIRTQRVSFCPVGQDVPIVAPDGTINACYLLERDWKAQGLNLRLGQLEAGSAKLDREAVQSIRNLNVTTKPACSQCFCKWHCAGGCHVNHVRTGPPGQYDSLCIQTRVITLYNILGSLGRQDLARTWAENLNAMQTAVLQPSDCLMDIE